MQNDNFNQGFKYYRVLKIYGKLMSGEVVNKTEEARAFGVTERTFQRDIEDLRCFFADDADDGGGRRELVYSRELNGYHLVNEDTSVLNDSEFIAVCKILLESRAFAKEEMASVINKLLECCVQPESRRIMDEWTANELRCYLEPRGRKRFIDYVGDISKAVSERRYMKIVYIRQDGSETERVIKPVGIMFSEYYFYLSAISENVGGGIHISAYRIDMIRSFEILDRCFDVPDGFDEIEFRSRMQFMNGGKLRRIKLLYKGKNVGSVLDRFPASRIVGRTDEGFVLITEVFGDGMDTWAKSRGNAAEILNG
ncbi:MAG: WYL domain-containing protein [Oscillospiraceae bacterium]|nr:WYL domain-containing protein [Oscillospiraceae bacterium]